MIGKTIGSALLLGAVHGIRLELEATATAQAFHGIASDSAYSKNNKAVIDAAINAGTVFTDADFPADNNSLGVVGGDTAAGAAGTGSGGVSWTRAKDIYPGKTLKLFAGSETWSTMQQGTMGDCYLLATLVAFDARPGALERLWYTQTANAAGIYAMKFHIGGEERLVYVDDNLPTRNGRLTYANSRIEGELWPPLAEKIWAKLVGSYAAIEAGNSVWVLKYLTDDPVQHFRPRNMTE